MAHPQHNFTSNFNGSDGHNAELTLNINGVEKKYTPAGNDQTYNVPGVARIDINLDGADLVQAIQTALDGSAQPVLVERSIYDEEVAYPYIGDLDGAWYFGTCTTNKIVTIAVDKEDGAVNGEQIPVANGVVIVPSDGLNVYSQLRTAIALGQLPVLSYVGANPVYAQYEKTADNGDLIFVGALATASDTYVQYNIYTVTSNNTVTVTTRAASAGGGGTPDDENGFFNTSLYQTPGDGVTESLTLNDFRIKQGTSIHGSNIEFVVTHQEGGIDFGEVWLNPGTYILNIRYTLQWVGNPRGTFAPLVCNVGGQPFDFSFEQENTLITSQIRVVTARQKVSIAFPFDADTPRMGIWVETLSIAQLASNTHPAVVHDTTLAGSGTAGSPLGVTTDVFGKIKDIPTSISQFRTGDVIPVDGPNGPAKMPKDDLLTETAQNAKNYCCYTDSVANGANIASIDLSYSGQIVFTFRMSAAITESGFIILNKTGTSANTSIIVIAKANVGIPFKLYVDSNGSCIVKNISGSALDVKIISATDRWDLKRENPTHWDSETATEYGVVYRVSPEEGFDYESVRTFSVLANENIASIDYSYSGQIIFSFRTVAAITENGFVILNKTGTSANTSIIVVAKENVGIPFKLFVDSNGSCIVKNVSGSAIDVKIVSVTDRWTLKRENPVHWDSESANEYGFVYNLSPQTGFNYGSVRTFSVLSNENVASIDYSYSGQIIFSFRMSAAVTESGLAILNKTGTSANTSIIVIAKENVGFPFKLYVDSNGSSVIKNISGSAIDVKVVSATDRWDLKRENPTHWDAGTATEYGVVYNLSPSRYSKAAETNIHSLKYVVNASRYNKDLNGKHDFTFCIVTDSHDDWRSVYHAVDITNDFLPIDICIHCGDAMGNVYEYGRTQVDQWNTSVAMAKKPIYFVVGNHEAGTYPNIEFSPTQAQLYNAFIKPLVDKGFIANGEYTVDKCYYFHDFVNSKIRLIVLNEFEAPQDIDDTYWEPITYDSSKPNIAANTTYNIDDIVNVNGYDMYSFRCRTNIDTGVYYSGYWPKYKILGKSRWFTKTQLDWFYSALNTTPEDYSVVIALHQPVSPNSKNQASMMFGDTEFGNNAPGIHIQSVMSGDVIADIINAFKNKGTYSATIQGTGDGAYLTPFSVSYDFSDANSVNNIITIGGHAHKDLLWKHDTYEYLFNITPTTANTAISGNAGYKLSNEMRLKTTESDYCCDALTCISFGHSNRIALTKIGVDVTIDAEPRNFQIINN